VAREVVCIDRGCVSGAVDAQQLVRDSRELLEVLRKLDELQTDVFSSAPYYEFAAGNFGRAIYEILYEGWLSDQFTEDELRELRVQLERLWRHEGEPAEVNLVCTAQQVDVVSHDYPYLMLIGRVREPLGVLYRVGDAPQGIGSIMHDATKVHALFFSNAKQITQLLRYSFQLRATADDELHDAAARAFPLLHFHEKLSVNSFGLDLNEHLPTVCLHLGFLNDEFLAIAKESGWDLPQVIAAAKAKAVDFSDESDNTKRAKQKIRERNVAFLTQKGDPKVVLCTLHTKITATRGRIHFHPPVPEIAPGRLLVGKFCEHLPV